MQIGQQSDPMREDDADLSISYMQFLIHVFGKYKKLEVRQVGEEEYWIMPLDRQPFSDLDKDDAETLLIFELQWEETLQCYPYKHEL